MGDRREPKMGRPKMLVDVSVGTQCGISQTTVTNRLARRRVCSITYQFVPFSPARRSIVVARSTRSRSSVLGRRERRSLGHGG
jgi:hypothetical protein